MRRCVLGVAIAILIAGGMTFAQEQGKGQQGLMQKVEYVWEQPGLVIGPCGNAVIVTRFRVAATEIYHYAKGDSINPVSLVASYRSIEPSLYYLGNASSEKHEPIPGTKTAMGVPGETEIDHVDFVKGIFKGQGSIFQVTVPGYGRLFSETGHQVADLAYNWLSNRGQNDFWEQHLEPLCDYLSSR